MPKKQNNNDPQKILKDIKETVDFIKKTTVTKKEFNDLREATVTKKEFNEMRETTVTKKEFNDLREATVTKKEFNDLREATVTKKEFNDLRKTTVTKKEFNEMRETVDFVKETAATKSELENLATKEELLKSKNEILNKVDGFISLHEKVDLELTAHSSQLCAANIIV